MFHLLILAFLQAFIINCCKRWLNRAEETIYTLCIMLCSNGIFIDGVIFQVAAPVIMNKQIQLNLLLRYGYLHLKKKDRGSPCRNSICRRCRPVNDFHYSPSYTSYHI